MRYDAGIWESLNEPEHYQTCPHSFHTRSRATNPNTAPILIDYIAISNRGIVLAVNINNNGGWSEHNRHSPTFRYRRLY